MNERILLFIPCYNCAPQIGRVIAQIEGPVAGRIAQTLVLDNRSTDDTVERACAAAAAEAPALVVGRNRENYHLGGSHKAAFAYAASHDFSHVVVLHGDDQARLADLAPVLDRGDHLTQDACLGARFMRGARLEGYSPFRRAGNAVFNRLFSLLSGRPVHDLGSGLNVFARSVFADPLVLTASDDLRFNVYLLLALVDRKRRFGWFPISWREEDQVSNVRLLSQAWRTLAIGWEYLVARARFRTADHRDRPVTAYGFDVVAEFGR
ncbi:MAG TPA: glycosyltransferase family 2 protein [Caulobacteraceae bacterium]|nr:glycosyltransferase family 2 protein [Caulobacteraceae bacterium]